MAKLPAITGMEAIRRFERVGYLVARQRGSHVRMRHPSDPNCRPLTIPIHHGIALKPGLLRALIRQAGLSVEQFAGLEQ